MNTSGIISLSNLRFSYDVGLDYAINDLSLEIPAGTIAAILGPNGAGKSTLLHILLGMLTPQDGQVLLDGKDLSSYSRREMSRLVGIVPQIEHIPFEFSVMEYVLLGRAPYLGILQMPSDEDYQKVSDILQRLNLSSLAQRVVLDLSGGERQMVLLARALAQQPRILLLDEPTSHLDLSNKGHILQILRDLAKQGVTVIFTTHDPYTAGLSARYLILMREGRILDTGPIEDVLKSDKLSSTYGVPVRVVDIKGHPVILLDEPLP